MGLVVLCCASASAAAQPDGGSDTGADATPEPAEPAPSDAPAEPPRAKPLVEPAAPEADKGTQIGVGDLVIDKSPFTYEPFGYLRMQYIAVQNDPNVQHVGRDDGFEIQNARIGVRGSWQDRVRYAFSIDGAVDERLQNSPQGKLRVGLRDAFADVVFGNKVFVRGGFFQTWADPQRLVPDVVREFVDRPLWSRGVRSTEGFYTQGLPPGRSIGAAVRLEPAVNNLGFELAVQNGADEFSSSNDNDLPAVSVAAMFRLPNDSFIVASGRINPRTEGELPFRQDETDIQGAAGVQINASALRFGAGGVVQRTTFGSTGGPTQNAYGAHAQLAFRIPSSSPLYIGYRFGILDASSLILSDRVMEHTAGGALAVPSLRMRFQLQVTHVMEQAERDLSNSRVQVAAEVTL